jgi:hypothetical protein
MRLQLLRGDNVGINFASQRDERLGALLDELFSNSEGALDDNVMVTR